MKKSVRIISCIAVCLLLVMVFPLLFGCQSNAQANKRRRVNSVNHRGYSDAPENTLAAFRLSKEKGFDMVECDVQFTADNHAVLLHDATVDRTSNGSGRISEMTLENVRKLDFGSWKSEEYAGEQIPTFDEFVALCVELQLHPYVEVKTGATGDQMQKLLDIVRNADLTVTWISFDRKTISFIAQQRPKARVGLLTHLVTKDDLSFLSELMGYVDVFIDSYYPLLTSKDVKQCKQYAIPLEIWTVNSQKSIADVDPYISGVTSDYVNAQEVFNTL